jgi:hypothetical protein
MSCVEDRQGSGLGGDRTGVPDLAAGFGVERSDVEEDLDLLAVLGPLDHFTILHHRQDPARPRFGFVSGKHGRSGLVDDATVELSRNSCISAPPRLASAASLALHLLVEASPIDLDPALGGNLGRELDRKSERVVELERHRPGELVASGQLGVQQLMT